MGRDLRSSGIVRELISFSLPLILSGVLQQLYLWADAFIVGNVEGEGALAAIGATTTLMNFFLLLVIGFTGGLSILFARSFGAGETKDIPDCCPPGCWYWASCPWCWRRRALP